MSAPDPVREPASSPCQAPPGHWGEDELPAKAPCEDEARREVPGHDQDEPAEED